MLLESSVSAVESQNTASSPALTVFVDRQPQPVPVLDLSRGGLRLRLERPSEAGTLATLEVHDRASGCVRLRLVRLDDPYPASDGAWLVGGNFLRPLTDGEFSEMAGVRVPGPIACAV